MTPPRRQLKRDEFSDETLAFLEQLANAKESGCNILYGPFLCFESRRAWIDANFMEPKGIRRDIARAIHDELLEDFGELEEHRAPWSETEKSKAFLPPDRHRKLTLIQLWVALRVYSLAERGRPTMRMAANVLTRQRMLRGHAKPDTSVFVWRKWRQRAIERFIDRKNGEMFARLIVPLLRAKRTRTKAKG